VKATGNFAGIVLNYSEQYDYPAVQSMYRHNVPVYVSWPGPGLNPYTSYHQHQMLKRWLPSPKLFGDLKNFPKPLETATPSLPDLSHIAHSSVENEPTYDHPMDYVKRQDRARSVRKFPLGRAAFFRIDSHIIVDKQTGEEKEHWVHTRVTKHRAKIDFEAADPNRLWWVPLASFPPSLPEGPPRFDGILNEWNYSEEFNFMENEPTNTRLASDEFDEWDELSALEDGQMSNAHQASVDRVLVSDLDDPVGEEEAGIPLYIPISTLRLNSLVQSLFDNRHLVDPDLADAWLDEADFLLKRWGLTLSGVVDSGPDNYSMTVGARKNQADLAVVELFNAVVKGGSATIAIFQRGTHP
jgi:hypothetical protein